MPTPILPSPTGNARPAITIRVAAVEFSRHHDEAQTAEAVIIELDKAGLDQIDGILIPVVHLGDTPPANDETREEYAMRVLTALNAGGAKITYEYDFGAGWIHEIALQEKMPRGPGVDYPFCAKYSGDSPVEYPDHDSDGQQQPEPFDLEGADLDHV